MSLTVAARAGQQAEPTDDASVEAGLSAWEYRYVRSAIRITSQQRARRVGEYARYSPINFVNRRQKTGIFSKPIQPIGTVLVSPSIRSSVEHRVSDEGLCGSRKKQQKSPRLPFGFFFPSLNYVSADDIGFLWAGFVIVRDISATRLDRRQMIREVICVRHACRVAASDFLL